MTGKVAHNPESNRFELREDGSTAYVEYVVGDDFLDIIHTIVPWGLENRGIGSALVAAAYNWGREQGLSPKASCSFARAWLARHS